MPLIIILLVAQTLPFCRNLSQPKREPTPRPISLSLWLSLPFVPSLSLPPAPPLASSARRRAPVSGLLWSNSSGQPVTETRWISHGFSSPIHRFAHSSLRQLANPSADQHCVAFSPLVYWSSDPLVLCVARARVSLADQKVVTWPPLGY